MTATISTTMSAKKTIDFVERNNLKAFREILRDWLAIALIITFSIWANNLFVYLVSVWLIGIFQFALGESLVHEAVHYNLFIKKSWHYQLQFIYCFPFLRTLYSYQKHHLPHHTQLWTDKDYIPKDYEDLGLNKKDKNLFMILLIKPLLGFSVIYFLLDAFYDFFQGFNISIRQKDGSLFKSLLQLCLFWLVVIFCFSLSGNLDILLLYWFVPLLWCYSFYSLLAEVQQHFNTLSGARTIINPVLNFLFHNGGYHYVHHLCATIPWYNLPEAHQAFCSDNPDISKGILDTYKQLGRDNSDIKLPEIVNGLNILRAGHLPLRSGN
ncbi:MAG: fatty acid desaturase family protein [Synechocystis sp.]|jgi:fatty acid desaturase